jgi:tetratricopeptide (TPR) repeat protein
VEQRLITLLEQGFHWQQQGEITKARHFYLKVLAADGDNIFALNLMGVVSIKSGEILDAINYLQKALLLEKNDAETYSNLGLAYIEVKRLADAQKMFEQSLKINPQQAVVLNNLGNVFASLNEHNKALSCFDAAMKLDNGYIACINNMLVSLKALHLYDKALDLVNYALKHEPRNSVTINYQGEIYKQRIDYEKARACFECAIKIDNSIVAKINLASVLKLMGQEQQAKVLLQEVLQIEPNNAEAANHLGVLFEQLGDFEQAANYFRLALTHSPAHASAYFQLSKLKNQHLTDDEVDSIKRLIDDELTLDIFKSSLFLALAWHYDKQKCYEKSMSCFIQGKAIKAKTFPYDDKAPAEYLALCKSLFPVKPVEIPQTQDDPLPIFVIGMPRSGTTLTEQILASHSKIYGAGELGYINELIAQAERLTEAKYPRCLPSLTTQQIIYLRQYYLNKMKTRCGDAQYFVDKNPLNYHSIGFIVLIFPEAKFIYCQRNAMDNCVSIFKLPFDDNQSYSHELSALGDYYLQHTKLMALWQACYPDHIICNEYEQTVADIEQQARKLLDFIGLPFEQAVLSFYENKRIVLTPSAQQVRQPIYNASINSWQRYGDALAPLFQLLYTKHSVG